MKRSNFYSILYVFLTVAFLMILSSSVHALKAESLLPERPANNQLVFNLSSQFPEFLSAQEQNNLNFKLSNFARETSNQIVVLVIDSFSGMEVNDFATQLFNKWGIGQDDKNNGLLLLIKPTVEEGGRKIYISVGYGLESAVPDLMANRVIDEVISPSFKAANFYAGIDKSTDILMSLAVGEFDEKVLVNDRAKGDALLWILFIPFLFMFFSEMFLSRTGESVDISKKGLRRRHGAYYLPFFLGSSYSYHGRSSGFGSSSGGGFGGFGGFGGGMSGGGGAGGSW